MDSPPGATPRNTIKDAKMDEPPGGYA